MVKSVVDGVTTYYVGGVYELEVGGSEETERKDYSAGGGRIAVRVDGTLNWILSDHLGSTTVTAHADGSWRGGIAYTPFGETRSSQGTTPTDYRYREASPEGDTGQRLEAELGLYFYQARWYDPGLGVFTQADTIIPNPVNPLDMNRYSYVRNNPLKYTDPSGHVCYHVNGKEICSDDDDWSVIRPSFDHFLSLYGVTLTGNWSVTEKRSVYRGVKAVGSALAHNMGGVSSGAMAFKMVYGHMTFERLSGGLDGYGITKNRNLIQFSNFYRTPVLNERLVVHELGHAFDHSYTNLMGVSPWGEGSPYIDIGSVYELRRPQGDYGNRETGYFGFAGGRADWQFCLPEETDYHGENFADSFVGWTYGKWGTGDQGIRRSAHMKTHMRIYLREYQSLYVSYVNFVEKYIRR